MMEEMNMIYLDVLNSDVGRDSKGLNPYGNSCSFERKKCCKKYKDGKRCKKCPKR